jgi:hypothetical protein
MPQGTVKWFNSEKDYNCISPDDGGGPRRVYSLTFLEGLFSEIRPAPVL